jgi:hypothetical protein
LVIDQTLINSHNKAREHLKQVERCTAGIIYLGTPHYGADLAAWASVGAKFLKFFKDTNAQIVSALTHNSEILQETQEHFGQWLDGRRRNALEVEITCFFEELAVIFVGKVSHFNIHEGIVFAEV